MLLKKKVHVDILIIGRNRAAFTSAIYCSRANIKTIILDKYIEDTDSQEDHKIENLNLLSFIVVPRNKDIKSLQIKAEGFGAKFEGFKSIEKMILTDHVKIIETEKYSYVAKAIIITVGNNEGGLEIPSEKKFRNHGIYYNGFLETKKFKGKSVAVIGEGNSCVEEALYLSKIVKKVIIIRKNKKIEDNNILIKRELEKSNNITFLNGYELQDIFGHDNIEGICLNEINTRKKKNVKIDAIFACSKKKNNSYHKFVNLDYKVNGYIKVNEDMETSIKGVFAVGASIAKVFDEIPTDINEATVAALSAIRYLN